MEDGAKGRAWFGLTAFAVLFGLIVQVLVAANATGGAFDTTAGRVFNRSGEPALQAIG